MKITERKLQEIGQSLLISLPKAWATTLKLKKGSVIKIIQTEQGNLTISPELTNVRTKKEIVLEYDEHFRRRFIREYFSGAEKITFQITKNYTDTTGFYTFLKKFMNAQLIEETPKKLVIKCFTIDELSIEECLRRMYFLTITMFDECMGENVESKKKEMEETLTRFYYMLVMQIRRFLSEGRYTQDKQMSLIRAMDCRMVAEKIERIGDVLKEHEPISDPAHRKFCDEIKDFYSRAFSCFISANYEKAHSLWQGERDLRKKYAKLDNATQLNKYKHFHNLSRVLAYAKEISLLIR